MIWQFFFWAWQRLRPQGGWLSLALLLAVISCLVSAVLEARWVPEVNVVAVTMPLGLLLGCVLGHQSLGSRPGWGIIASYGWLVTVYSLSKAGQIWLILWRDGLAPAGDSLRQHLALLADRTAGWFEAALANQRTTETVVFAFGLGLVGWLLAAYAGWSTYRTHRPLSALGLIGLALAFNTYYGQTAVWPVVLYVALAVALMTIAHYTGLEQDWERRGIDYSLEIRLELLFTAGGMALALLAISFALPAINFSTLARAFQRSAPVKQVEQTLEQVFAGVRQPQPTPFAVAQSGQGVWPRSFLLGNPPELATLEVISATTALTDTAGIHWRATSYDLYTGRGWAFSDERQERIPAGTLLGPQPGSVPVSQTVRWLAGPTTVLYTLGLPLAFDRPVTLVWRGLEDLVRVQGSSTIYTATSQLILADPAGLSQATLAQVPPLILARYTQLPAGIPGRVAELARGITAPFDKPYDQAKAIERFLRQYPYSLDVGPPPAGRDPVDYFLFELQRGYCDYYASAMVIMARQVGLPARLATGYLPSPINEAGIQVIYASQAHAWAEIYFAGYGWLEFEPTAAFPMLSEASTPVGLDLPPDSLESELSPPPIPSAVPGRPLWWLGIVMIGLLAAGYMAWRWRRAIWAANEDEVGLVYGKLLQVARRLGQPTPAGQTPSEFEAAFLGKLKGDSGLRPGIQGIVRAFIWRQYSGQPQQASHLAETWRQLRRPLWWLWLSGRGQKGPLHIPSRSKKTKDTLK